MKLFSKVLVSLIAVLMLAVPVFAGGASEGSGDAKTITFVSLSTQANGIRAVFDEYQKTHPDVELDLVPCSTVTDFETVMTGYIAANTLPDMYLTQISSVQQEYAAEGYLMPLTDTGVMENMIDGDTELIMWNDDYYAFPMISEVSGMIVNNAVLKQAGINIDITNYPKSFSDLLVDILKSNLIALSAFCVPLKLLTFRADHPCLLLILCHLEWIACGRNVRETYYLNRIRWPCTLDFPSFVIKHGADTSRIDTSYIVITLMKRTLFDDDSCHYTSALVDSRLKNLTDCATVWISLELKHLGLKENRIKQIVDTFFLQC